MKSYVGSLHAQVLSLLVSVRMPAFEPIVSCCLFLQFNQLEMIQQKLLCSLLGLERFVRGLGV